MNQRRGWGLSQLRFWRWGWKTWLTLVINLALVVIIVLLIWATWLPAIKQPKTEVPNPRRVR